MAVFVNKNRLKGGKLIEDAVYRLAEELSAGRGAVVATVVASRGSTPRGPGAQMLVRADGSALGTVGGGAVELEAARLARDLCREGRSMAKTYRLTNTQAGDLGMVCGGEADILFQYVAPAGLPQIQKILRALEDRTEPRWLVTAFALDSWRWGLCDGAGSCPYLGGIPGERLLPLAGEAPRPGGGGPGPVCPEPGPGGDGVSLRGGPRGAGPGPPAGPDGVSRGGLRPAARPAGRHPRGGTGGPGAL